MSAFASPPLRAISPNSKPALRGQRDHSACRRPDTRLKVRKTRENLRDTSLYPDIPPPCLHTLPNRQDTDGKLDMELAYKDEESSATHNAPSDSTLPSYDANDVVSMPPPPLPQLSPARIQRHKSVSRRMLSKVKQGISNRSKIAQSIRPIEPETSLIRRISGRRKQSVEMERRAHSFEISRDSVASALDEDLGVITPGSVCPPQRSVTDSTVSTSELSGDSPVTPPNGKCTSSSRSGHLPSLSLPPNSSPLELTPRPPSKDVRSALPLESTTVHVAVPYVELLVTPDRAAIDAGSEHAVWVAIEAAVHSQSTTLSARNLPDDAAPTGGTQHDTPRTEEHTTSKPASTGTVLGSITSLRLCFKPADGCRVLDIVGQKTVKDLVLGQTCALFVKVHVPHVHASSSGDCTTDTDQASILTELESIIGTLETDVLHVESRYRHSLLPPNNVVTIRHTAKVRRPKIESQWSIVGAAANELSASDEMHTKLAIHIADHYPVRRALKLMDRCLGAEKALQSEAVRQIRQTLLNEVNRQQTVHNTEDGGSADKPSVVVTDIDTPDSGSSSASAPAAPPEHFSTAPCTPLEAPRNINTTAPSSLTAPLPPPAHKQARSPSLSSLPTPAPPAALSAIKTTTPASTTTSIQKIPTETSSDTTTTDEARKLWRHIRHSSLSSQQLADLAAQPAELAANDEVLKELRRKALANKRSVGAETLKGWKWEGKMMMVQQKAEAPWL